MNTDKQNPSQILAKVVMLYSALNEFLIKFAESMTNNASTTSFTWSSEDGTPQTINIPSVGYLSGEVAAMQQQLESLINANDDTITLKYKDGSVRSFEMVKMYDLVTTLEQTKDTVFTVPAEFKIKNNWFFESFLNPLIFIPINVTALVTDNKINRFSVRRVIVNIITSSDKSYFDENLKGRGDIDYDTIIQTLDAMGMDYSEDDNIYELPMGVNRYVGSFSVLKVNEETINVGNVQVKQGRYVLDKLSYTDILNQTDGTKFLAVGDILITKNDSEYKVLSVDRSTTTVVLERTFGNDPIYQGVDVIKIKPFPYRIPELQVNVGYNEREIIFTKPIADTLALTGTKFTKGIAIFTNELNIKLTDGNEVGLSEYYNTFVTDIGMVLMNFAKEKQVPSVIALTPSTPVINEANFQVININSQVSDTQSTQDIKDKIATKEKLQNELNEINKTINDLKAKLNDSATSNDQERLKIKKQIDENVKKRTSTLNQLSTVIMDITLKIKTNVNFKVDKKYRIRGFFEIPAPQTTDYGSQEIIQTIYSYRYISKSGTASNVNQLNFTDSNGVSQIGFFSNWNEVASKIRRKTYDSTKGIYVWATEDPKDPDVININQLDIPINPGEMVEIRVRVVSEAGYPINPAMSAWSDAVIVPFPADLETTQEDSILADQLMMDEMLVKFQAELDARSLDSHLLNSIFTSDKYYSHRLEDIISGWYTAEGKIINAYEKIKTMETTLNAIQTSITTNRGSIKVSVIDDKGNITEVKNGDTVSLFGGYYKDLITSQGTPVHGKIITKTYVISIENTSDTPLELAARIAGGIDQALAGLNLLNQNDDYIENRRYDLTSLVAVTNKVPDRNGYKHIAGWQSANMRSQFIYSRYKDYGLNNSIYTSLYNTANTYDYKGVPGIGNTVVPTIQGNYLPYNPSYSSLSVTKGVNVNVWNGTIANGPTLYPQSKGYLSEFCIHVNHPALIDRSKFGSGITVADIELALKPVLPSATKQNYYYFAQGQDFEISVDEDVNAIGNKYYQQAQYKKVDDDGTHSSYPIKLGFYTNDEWLIGKYTCGSYLFLAPSKYEDVSIKGNHPALATRSISFGKEHAINIPLIYQFRCSDKLGYIGGYRLSEVRSNIIYNKKLGIDIYEKGNTGTLTPEYGDMFVFDIDASCQYMKETPIVSPVNMPSVGNILPVNYSIQ